MTTDPATLPQWKGKIAVPWIARWTGQIVRDPISVSIGPEGKIWATYAQGEEVRDELGVLWMREGLNRRGDPEFGQVSVYRQRAAMNKRLCQVCGKKIPPGPIRWLMSRQQLEVDPKGEVITQSPPTCDDCIPLALELCPHLKDGNALVAKVLEYDIWGAYGEAVGLDDNMNATRHKGKICYERINRYPFPPTAFCARQSVARFIKFVMED